MPVMSEVEQAFCRSAPWRGFARHMVLPWALHDVEPSGHMLELGSGSGVMAEATARAYPTVHVTATDIDPAMVKATMGRLAKVPNAEAKQADVTTLPFGTSTFDVVACYLMLHDVIQWRAALDEAARVLKPGGTFVGYDLTKSRIAEWIHIVDRSPHHLISGRELAPALRDAGFATIAVQPGWAGHVIKFTAQREK